MILDRYFAFLLIIFIIMSSIWGLAIILPAFITKNKKTAASWPLKLNLSKSKKNLDVATFVAILLGVALAFHVDLPALIYIVFGLPFFLFNSFFLFQAHLRIGEELHRLQIKAHMRPAVFMTLVLCGIIKLIMVP